ncbi:MAG: ABC transporter permease [Pirellulaceae bacterium]
MSPLLIAWRSIQQRGLASILTTTSMMLGVVLVVMVLSIHGVVSESFRSNASLGYNMIVGAKGGKLQLTLNTVYYLSTPVENVPYDFYLEFKKQDQRRQEMRSSFAGQAAEDEAAVAQMQTLAALGAGPASLLTSGLTAAAVEQTNDRQMGVDRDGTLAAYPQMLIPLCLGDYYGRFRVVGTVPEMFEQLQFGPDRDRSFEFADGRNFQHYNDKHQYFEAVLGATVAREMNVGVGDQFSPAHGAQDGHTHERKFTIVGVLAPTGTPNDRAAFINMEGFYLMEDHAKPIKSEDRTPIEPVDPATLPEGGMGKTEEELAYESPDPLPVEQREITALLVNTNPRVAPGLENTVNEGPHAQAVFPVREIYNLFSFIVEPIQMVLLGLTAMICIVSGISILVSIYNSMSDRRHEIAIMRALGAGRGTVMSIILLESVLLSMIGGAGGWLLAHLLNQAAAGYIVEKTGVSISFLSIAPAELLIVPGLLLLAVAVGFLPAMSAYRTDVARSIGK